MIEESEKVDLKSATQGFKKLSEIFKGRRLALLHGRLKSEEKESTMKAFAAGEIDVLLTTALRLRKALGCSLERLLPKD